MSIALNSSRVRPIISVFDICASPNVIRTIVLDPNLLNNILQRDMLDIHSTPSTKINLSGTVTLHLRMARSQTRVNLGVMNEPVVPVLLASIYIDRFIKWIRPAEKKGQSLPLRAGANIDGRGDQE